MEIDGGPEVELFAQQTQEFLSWFRGLPGATFHESIQLEDLRGSSGAGRGIVATADIAPETVLFTIPRNSIICAATSSLATQIPSVFSTDDVGDSDSDDEQASNGKGSSSKGQDSWTRLILILIHEHLQGPASRWKAYLDVLPREFSTPMFWPSEDLAELRGSDVVRKIGREEADDMIRSRIVPVIRAHQDVFFGPEEDGRISDDQLVELAHRMGSAIMAYAFDLEKDEDEEEEAEDEWVEDREGRTMLGMVPMADMLNADAEFNAHINHGEDALTAVALRPIRKGEEIFNYYGPLSNGELLRRYGYVTRRHARYDVVELPWALVEKQLRARFAANLTPAEWEKAEKYLRESYEEEGEEPEESYVIEYESKGPDATGQFQDTETFTGLPEELGERVKTYLKALKKGNSSLGDALADKAVRKEVYLQAVGQALKEREAQYPTALEADEGLITSGTPTGRQEMALMVRVGEKRLLRRAQEWAALELEGLRRETSGRSREERNGDDGAPAAKRRRA